MVEILSASSLLKNLDVPLYFIDVSCAFYRMLAQIHYKKLPFVFAVRYHDDKISSVFILRACLFRIERLRSLGFRFSCNTLDLQVLGQRAITTWCLIDGVIDSVPPVIPNITNL